MPLRMMAGASAPGSGGMVDGVRIGPPPDMPSLLLNNRTSQLEFRRINGYVVIRRTLEQVLASGGGGARELEACEPFVLSFFNILFTIIIDRNSDHSAVHHQISEPSAPDSPEPPCPSPNQQAARLGGN